MYLDADVLYARIKPTDWLENAAERVPNGQEVTSAITIIELMLIAERDYDRDFANMILEQTDVTILDCTETILEHCVSLRKQYDLNIFDAVHAATALHHDLQLCSSDAIYEDIDRLDHVNLRAR